MSEQEPLDPHHHGRRGFWIGVNGALAVVILLWLLGIIE